MANNYIIDFSDPLSGSFTIPDAGFNGPGGKVSSTTLRLYGRGAPQWGESVDENFVKLLENFMGATEPLNPKPGQMWVKTFLYYRDTDDNLFYAYNLTTASWALITVTSAATAPSTPASGQYWYDTTTSTLKKYFQAYKQQTATWHIRACQLGTANPTGLVNAHQELVMWDASGPRWVQAPVATWSSSTAAPTGSRAGTLRYDPATGRMYYWSALASNWVQFDIGGVNPTMVADLDMGGFKVINMAAPTDPGHGVNLGTGDARYVKKAGDSMTGQLTLGAGNPTAALHAANKAYVDTQSAAAAAAAVSALVTFPPGGIIMWSGAIGAIPAGWVLCNGQNGTPDLRDRFVIGAGLAYPASSVGGSKDAVVVSHTHTISGTTDSGGWHAHAVSDPGHQHQTAIPYKGNGFGAGPFALLDGNQGILGHINYTSSGSGTGISIQSAGTHAHNISGSVTSSGVSGTNANLPPYYALAFIMKT